MKSGKKVNTVQRLDIHLPGQYRMANTKQTQEDLADIGQRGSTLEAYLRYNAYLKQQQQNQAQNENQQEIQYYYYWQMPEHFRWIGSNSEWQHRVRSLRVIGRVHSVNFVSQPELYHLQLLLYHVKDATSFDDF